MKFNHNKKRNTAFIYEVLIAELSKASMASDNDKKNKLVNLLKENFSKGKILKRDLDIYRSFDDVSDLDGDMVVNLIQEAKKQFISLNRKNIYNQQTFLINEINKNFGVSTWSSFVSNYKKLATINQTINKSLPPKKQVLIEKKLINLLSQSDSEKKPFPNVNNLAVKTFIEKFNREYDTTLSSEQKLLLEKYIMSPNDGGMEFKIHLYEEIDRLKDVINGKINKNQITTPNKLQKIIDRMNNYNTRALDRGLIAEVMKIQSLAKEINQ